MRRGPRIALPRGPLRCEDTALRRWRPDDGERLVALCRDAAIARWIDVSAVEGLQDAAAWVVSCERSAQAGLAANLAIVAADGDTLIGSVGLIRIDSEQRRAEVGYWLGADARGRGHATRAVGLICRWGFRELRLERISLLAAVANPSSQAVADRAGFTREAVLRAYDPGPEGRDDVVCFARLDTDR